MKLLDDDKEDRSSNLRRSTEWLLQVTALVAVELVVSSPLGRERKRIRSHLSVGLKWYRFVFSEAMEMTGTLLPIRRGWIRIPRGVCSRSFGPAASERDKTKTAKTNVLQMPMKTQVMDLAFAA